MKFPKMTRRIGVWEGLSGFSGVRSRILTGYFLLTACVTFVSVHATYKIFCNSTQREIGRQLQQDLDLVQQFAQQHSEAQLEQFLIQKNSTPNRQIMLVTTEQVIPAQIKQAEMIRRWAGSTSPGTVAIEGYLIRVVEPLNNQSMNQSMIVAVEDATMQYHMAELTLEIVVKVTAALLILFGVIAWLTAGKVLAPLRQVTETARSISETDLTQRLSVQGQDEIAELTSTFNQMLDRLESAFTSQQDFIKDVSHELRTPITIIQGHLELLGDDPKERQETIALVRDELKRMNRFVSDLLLLMRIERPNFLKLDTLDLTVFTEEVFTKAQGLAVRQWKLEAIASGEMICDRQRITQAILNLAQNATQYTQSGDVIAIGSANLEDCIQFWIRDTGEGISPEDQARIFDRFARGSNSERRSDGAGLGLSIVQALVKAHHGNIELWSRLGEGSTFTITLPKCLEEQQ